MSPLMKVKLNAGDGILMGEGRAARKLRAKRCLKLQVPLTRLNLALSNSAVRPLSTDIGATRIPGEIVDAACVSTSANRQMAPTTMSGTSALKVQRTFTADFRSDLVNANACVGFNGTDFLATDCTASGVELVSFQNGELRTARGACASGNDSAAQMTVDTTDAK